MTERRTPAEVRALMRQRQRTRLEDSLLVQLEAAGLLVPEREYRFHPIRRWRFDLAWPDRLVAVEVDGGIYSGGRHVRGKGYEADCEKLNSAALQGWMALRVTAHMVSDGRAVRTIKQAFET